MDGKASRRWTHWGLFAMICAGLAGMLDAAAGRALRSAEPRTFTIAMPDYQQEERAKWHDGVNDVYSQLKELSDDALAAGNGRLHFQV